MAEVEEIYRGDRDHHSGPVQAQGTAGRPKTEASTEKDGKEVIGRQYADRDGGTVPLGERRCASRKPGKREASRVVESREHFQAVSARGVESPGGPAGVQAEERRATRESGSRWRTHSGRKVIRQPGV